MKITFNKEELIKYLTPAMNTVSDKNTIAAVGGILFTAEKDNECIISSFDLEKGFRAAIEAKVERQGSYVIPAQKLFRIVRIMPDKEISIDVNDKNLVLVKSGKSEFRLSAQPGMDFPNLPELQSEKGFKIKCNEFRDITGRIQHAIAINEQQRPMLCGAYFVIGGGNIKIVACDGNRLAIRYKNCEISDSTVEDNFNFIIPGKTLSELLKLVPDSDDTMYIAFGRKHVIFTIDNMIFFSRLIEGEYINYERIIPATSKIFVRVNKNSLLDSLERVSLVADDKASGQIRSFVKCEFIGNMLRVSSKSSTYAVNDEIDTEKSGDDINIGFSCRYMCDALRAIDDDYVTLSMTGPLMSVVIRNEGGENDENEGYLYMICPIKMVD